MAGKLTYEKRRDYLWIVFGTFLMALSANLCFTPGKIVPGGFTGLAIIIKYLTAQAVPGGVPTWLSNVILNIPLILCAIKVRGWRFMRRTLAASVVFSLWLLVIPEYAFFGSDLVLITVIGGTFMGAGLGFAFAQMVSRNVFNSSITFQPLLLPVTIIVSILVTGLACLPPVRNATDVDPALVLKGE